MAGIICTYDGSFEGLLCVYSDVFDYHIQAEDIRPESMSPEDLFLEKRLQNTDMNKAGIFFNLLREKMSPAGLRRVFCTYLSETKNAEILLLNYIGHIFKKGIAFEKDYSNETVRQIIFLDRKVVCEAYRLKGIIRFQQLAGGLFYARIEPLYNVLCLLVPHFSARLKNEKWAIHDLKRGICALYDGRACRIFPADENPVKKEETGDVYEKGEKEIEELWKLYFNTIAIHERKNPVLQRNHMPFRYWKHILEVKERV